MRRMRMRRRCMVQVGGRVVHVSANDLTGSNQDPLAVNDSRRKRRSRPVVADGVRLKVRLGSWRSACRRLGMTL